MNSIIENYYGVFTEYQALRSQLLDMLTDQDLAVKIDGNPSLGELCRENGEVERSYIDSFKTLKQDFDYRSETPGIAARVDKLRSWYAELDAELREVIEGFSEEDVREKIIDRGFQVRIQTQLTIYNEALLIFYGKTSVYLKMLGKPLTEQWLAWIA